MTRPIEDETKRPGWFSFEHDFFDQYGPILGPYGLAVCMSLMRHSNTEGQCWPARETIAKETGVSLAQVKRILALLQELKLIKSEERFDRSGPESRAGQKTNLYQLYFLKSWQKKRRLCENPRTEAEGLGEQSGGSTRADRGLYQSQAEALPEPQTRTSELDPLNKNQGNKNNSVGDSTANANGSGSGNPPKNQSGEQPKKRRCATEEDLLPYLAAFEDLLQVDLLRVDRKYKSEIYSAAANAWSHEDRAEDIRGFRAYFNRQFPNKPLKIWEVRNLWPDYEKTLGKRVDSAEIQQRKEQEKQKEAEYLKNKLAALERRVRGANDPIQQAETHSGVP